MNMLYKIIENQSEKYDLNPIYCSTLKDLDWIEKNLEDLFCENISILIPETQLMIISQEKAGNEDADILALDTHGILYIFELKRWKANEDHILQVLRYGQKFGQYSYEKLESLFKNYEGNDNLNLAVKHFEYFSEINRINQQLTTQDFNKNQHFVVITNGVDVETIKAIYYWKSKGILIDSLPYYVYKDENDSKSFYFEFSSFNPLNEINTPENTGIFIVNTNRTWSDKNYIEMLQENKASAYGNRANEINKIHINDEIFLYHTKVGIIASGKAISGPQIKKGNHEEHFIKVKYDWKIDPDTESSKAISATEINNELDSNYCFRSTVFTASQELANFLKKKIKEKKSQNFRK